MDVASSHSSGTGPIVHYELPTADALEAKLVVERDSASALRDEVDMLRKQTAQSQAALKTTIKYLADFKTKQAETNRIFKVLKEKKEIKAAFGSPRGAERAERGLTNSPNYGVN